MQHAGIKPNYLYHATPLKGDTVLVYVCCVSMFVFVNIFRNEHVSVILANLMGKFNPIVFALKFVVYFF